MTDTYEIHRNKRLVFIVFRNDEWVAATQSKWGARRAVKQDQLWRKQHGNKDTYLVERVVTND